MNGIRSSLIVNGWKCIVLDCKMNYTDTMSTNNRGLSQGLTDDAAATESLHHDTIMMHMMNGEYGFLKTWGIHGD